MSMVELQVSVDPSTLHQLTQFMLQLYVSTEGGVGLTNDTGSGVQRDFLALGQMDLSALELFIGLH